MIVPLTSILASCVFPSEAHLTSEPQTLTDAFSVGAVVGVVPAVVLGSALVTFTVAAGVEDAVGAGSPDGAQPITEMTPSSRMPNCVRMLSPV